MTHTQPVRRAQRTSAGAAVLGLLALAGCGSSAVSVPTNTAGTAGIDLGSLHIRSAYVPEPASVDVAAAYLSITNSGGSADALMSVTTPDAHDVMAHDTVASGSGAEEMVPLGTTTVPSHQTVAFTVGHKHLMLDSPQAGLHQGDTVPLTLVFAHAGTVTLQVPVTGLAGPGGDGTPPSGPVPSGAPTDGTDMGGMTGMGG